MSKFLQNFIKATGPAGTYNAEEEKRRQEENESTLDKIFDTAGDIASGISNNAEYVANGISNNYDWVTNNISDTYNEYIPQKLKDTVAGLERAMPFGELKHLGINQSPISLLFSGLAGANEAEHAMQQTYAPTAAEYNYNFGKGAVSGASSVSGGIADIFGAEKTGNELNAISKLNKRDREYSGADNILSLDYLTNPSGLTYDVGNMAGSMAALYPSSFLAPATKVTSAAQTLKKLPFLRGLSDDALETMIRGSITSVPESLSEGGNVVRQAKEEGLDDPYLRGWKTAGLNLPALAISNGLEYGLLGGKIFKPSGKVGESIPERMVKGVYRSIPATVATSAQQGLEEYVQQGISNAQTDKEWGLLPWNASQDQIDSLLIGALTGAPMSGAASYTRSITNQRPEQEANTGNKDIDSYINEASVTYGIPTNIIQAQMQAESNFDQSAVSGAGAIGLMQLMPGTAEELGVDPNDPRQNVMGGVKYLKQMYDATGNWRDALIAYNEGLGAWQEGHRYAESVAYADKILNNLDGDIKAPTSSSIDDITINFTNDILNSTFNDDGSMRGANEDAYNFFKDKTVKDSNGNFRFNATDENITALNKKYGEQIQSYRYKNNETQDNLTLNSTNNINKRGNENINATNNNVNINTPNLDKLREFARQRIKTSRNPAEINDLQSLFKNNNEDSQFLDDNAAKNFILRNYGNEYNNFVNNNKKQENKITNYEEVKQSELDSNLVKNINSYRQAVNSGFNRSKNKQNSLSPLSLIFSRDSIQKAQDIVRKLDDNKLQNRFSNLFGNFNENTLNPSTVGGNIAENEVINGTNIPEVEQTGLMQGMFDDLKNKQKINENVQNLLQQQATQEALYQQQLQQQHVPYKTYQEKKRREVEQQYANDIYNDTEVPASVGTQARKIENRGRTKANKDILDKFKTTENPILKQGYIDKLAKNISDMFSSGYSAKNNKDSLKKLSDFINAESRRNEFLKQLTEEEQNVLMYLDYTFENTGKAFKDVLQEVENERKKIIDRYKDILRSQMKQGVTPRSVAYNRETGEYINSPGYSNNYQWYRDMTANGTRSIGKKELEDNLDYIAVEHLTDGYFDPQYGWQIPGGGDEQFHEMEDTINVLNSIATKAEAYEAERFIPTKNKRGVASNKGNVQQTKQSEKIDLIGLKAVTQGLLNRLSEAKENGELQNPSSVNIKKVEKDINSDNYTKQKKAIDFVGNKLDEALPIEEKQSIKENISKTISNTSETNTIIEQNKNNEQETEVTKEKNVITVTGDEFGKYVDLKDLRQKAKTYYKEHLQGTSVENSILGRVNLPDNTIDFTRRGISKSVSTSAKENKLLLIKYLPDLIRNATDISSNKNQKNKREAIQYSYLKSKAIIDGKEQNVEITIFTDVNGNKYYNHVLPEEENKKRSLSVYPVQAPERNGIPAIRQQASSINSISNSETTNNTNHISLNEESIKKEDTTVHTEPVSSKEALGTPSGVISSTNIISNEDINSNEDVIQLKENKKDSQEKQTSFVDVKTAEDDLLKAFGLKRANTEKHKQKKRVKIVDDSDNALEAEWDKLNKALDNLSANPLFNPEVVVPLFKIGMIYAQRGINNFANFSERMIEKGGERIKPWIKPAWNMTASYQGDDLDENKLAAAFQYVGSKWENGTKSLDKIKSDFEELVGNEQAEPYMQYIEVAHKGAQAYFNPDIPVVQLKENDNIEVKENVDGSTSKNTERDSEGNNKNPVGADNESEGSIRGNGEENNGQTSQDRKGQRSIRVQSSSSDTSRTTSDSTVRKESSTNTNGSTRNTNLSGSIRDSYEGSTVSDEGRTEPISKPSEERQLNEGNLLKQDKAISKEKASRLDDIKHDLPILLPEQQGDVLFAEERLIENQKPGVMFTNGTGTGKTYTGLGILKRFVNQGKKNILIVTPSNDINKAWIDAAKKDFDIKITPLENTNDIGKDVVVTTYANMGYNNNLVNREWDLILCDESHRLMSSEQAKVTASLNNLRALTYNHNGLYERFQRLRAEEYKTVDDYAQKIKAGEATEKEEKARQDLIDKLSKEREELFKQWQEIKEEDKPKVVFLSATPFSYVPNVDYAEGYLFNYDEDKEGFRSYNQPSPYEDFFIKHFGYRMRYNKLTKPDADVNTALMEIEFHKFLEDSGALSGRILTTSKDYDRGFILVDSGVGAKIDEGIQFLWDNNKKYDLLLDRVRNKLKGNKTRYILEAIKAKSAIDLVKEYLKGNKKVVIFHDFKKNEASNPFVLTKEDFIYVDDEGKSGYNKEAMEQYELFKRERPDLLNLNLKDLTSPINRFIEAFGDKVGIYNGSVDKKTRSNMIKEFNKDNDGLDVILIQRASGKEGISLHDRTGKKQRVLIDLGLPTRPTDAIQCEGRIYRVGVKTNAIFRYLNTGTNTEAYIFSSVIAERSSTAENLALGEKARNLKESFIETFEESKDSDSWKKYLPNSKTEGTGGVQRDRQQQLNITPFERAKSYYYANQKKTSKNKAREGIDYYPTPEPIGYKMVEFADIKSGDSVLEPSAGHGAIARFFPEDTKNVAIEPSSELANTIRLRFNKNGRVIESTFENYDVHNKFNEIVMNPPYGTAAKTAMEHLEKAFNHLRDGGRIVALLPAGNSMGKRLDKWLNGIPNAKTKAEREGEKRAVIMKKIELPSVTFERAGTKVVTDIYIIDKYENEADREKALKIKEGTLSFRNIDAINTLFDEIEDVIAPRRILKGEVIREEQNTPVAQDKKQDLYNNRIVVGTIPKTNEDVEIDVNDISLSNDGKKVFEKAYSFLDNQSKNSSSDMSDDENKTAAMFIAYRADTMSNIIKDVYHENYSPVDYWDSLNIEFKEPKYDPIRGGFVAGRFESDLSFNLQDEYTLKKVLNKLDEEIKYIGKNDSRVIVNNENSSHALYHELGHRFILDLYLLTRQDNCPQQLKDDFNSIREWITTGEKTNKEYLYTKSYGNSKEKINEEKFAESIIRYLYKGKTPINRLNRAVDKIKKRIQELVNKFINNYQTEKYSIPLDIEIPKKVKSAMDRLIYYPRLDENVSNNEQSINVDDIDFSNEEPIKYVETVYLNKDTKEKINDLKNNYNYYFGYDSNLQTTTGNMRKIVLRMRNRLLMIPEVSNSSAQNLKQNVKKYIEPIIKSLAKDDVDNKGKYNGFINIFENDKLAAKKNTSPYEINPDKTIDKFADIITSMIEKKKEIEAKKGNSSDSSSGSIENVDDDKFTLDTHTDTRNGELKYRVKVKEQMNFQQLKSLAKQSGGGYSRFAKGFLFSSSEDRQKFVNAVRGITDKEQSSNYSFAEDMYKKLDEYVDIREKADFDNVKIGDYEKEISAIGDRMGTPIYWFTGPKGFRGWHSHGTTYLNVNGNWSHPKVFWHETFHWIARNNPSLFNDMLNDMKKRVTPKQIEDYRKIVWRGDKLSEDKIIEEMMADGFYDVVKRVEYLRNLGKENKSLAKRLISLIRDLMNRFTDFLNNPKAGLTNTQKKSMFKNFMKLSSSIVDNQGNKLFERGKDGEIKINDNRDFYSIGKEEEESLIRQYGEDYMSVLFDDDDYSARFSADNDKSIDSGTGTFKGAFKNLVRRFRKNKNDPRIKTLLKGPKETKLEKLGDIGIMSSIFASPSRLADTVVAFKPLFTYADNGNRELHKLRGYFNRELNKAYKYLENKKDIEELNELLFKGDATSTEYGKGIEDFEERASKIVDETGVKLGTAKAYIVVRRLMNEAYNKLNRARQQTQTISATISKNKLMGLQKNKFTDVLNSEQSQEDTDEYLVTYEKKAYRTKTKIMNSVELAKARDNEAIQILEEKEGAYDEVGNKYFYENDFATPKGEKINLKDKEVYTVTFREAIPNINKLEGYIPHFFHDWFIIAENKDGIRKIIGSGRNLNEANNIASEYLKNNKDEKIVIQGKQFDFNTIGVNEANYAAIVGDTEYNEINKRLTEEFELTMDEAKKILNTKTKRIQGTGKHRFFGNVLHRKGVGGYEQKDLDWVLRHYFNSASRYVALETEFKPKAISYFERVFGDFNKDYDGNPLASFSKQYINDVNGNPSSVEERANKVLNNLPIWKQLAVSHYGDRSALQFFNSASNIVTFLKLGCFNPSSALMTFSQLLNSWALMSKNNPKKAFEELWKACWQLRFEKNIKKLPDEEKLAIEESGVIDELGLDSTSGYSKARFGSKLEKGMYLFTNSDRLIRRATVLAAYRQGRKELGMLHSEAVEYARKIDREANFEYAVHDSPNLMRKYGFITQFALQFQKYPIKQFELMKDMLGKNTNKKQKMVFWGGYLFLSGAFGLPAEALFWDIIASILDIDPELAIKEFLLECNKDGDFGTTVAVRTLMYGFFSNFGIDISSRFGMADIIPTTGPDYNANASWLTKTLSAVAGPTGTTIAQVASNSTQINLDTFRSSDPAFLNTLRAISPMLYNVITAWTGESYDYRGRITNKYDGAWDRLVRFMGFRSLDESVATDVQSIKYYKMEKEAKEKQDAIDNYLDAEEAGKSLAPYVRKLNELGVKRSTVVKAKKDRKKDRRERLKEKDTPEYYQGAEALSW